MLKLSRVFLPVVAVSFLVGCSSDDSPEEVLENILNKDSVALINLSGHAVTYERTSDQVPHTDGYCPPNDLRDAHSVANGDWSVLGDELTTNPIVGTAYTYTTDGTLKKNTIYNTNTADSFKVTKITEIFCL